MATATATAIPTQMYIDGKWCDARDGKTLAVINPADESTVAEVAYGDRATRSGRSTRRRRAFPAWRAVSAYDRAKILKRTADLIRERADVIARTLTQEQGKPLARGEGGDPARGRHVRVVRRGRKRAYGRIIPPSNIAKRHYAIKHPVGVVGDDHALELPGRHAQPEDRPGPGGGLHGREPAGRTDAADA